MNLIPLLFETTNNPCTRKTTESDDVKKQAARVERAIRRFERDFLLSFQSAGVLAKFFVFFQYVLSDSHEKVRGTLHGNRGLLSYPISTLDFTSRRKNSPPRS